jgi:hypothetical protein
MSFCFLSTYDADMRTPEQFHQQLFWFDGGLGGNQTRRGFEGTRTLQRVLDTNFLEGRAWGMGRGHVVVINETHQPGYISVRRGRGGPHSKPTGSHFHREMSGRGRTTAALNSTPMPGCLYITTGVRRQRSQLVVPRHQCSPPSGRCWRPFR